MQTESDNEPSDVYRQEPNSRLTGRFNGTILLPQEA
jgi:hypothetical protein